MPVGGAGVDAAGQASAAAQEGGPRRNGPPEFFLGDREFSVVRFLSTYADDDDKTGTSQVFVKRNDGRMWLPAPGAFDSPDGKYAGPSDQIPEGFQVAWRFGIYLYELARFNYRPPTPDAQGNLPRWAQNMEPVRMSPQLVASVNFPGNLGQRSEWAQGMDAVKGVNPGKDDGVRYRQLNRGFQVWFRGMGQGGSFPAAMRRLATGMGGNLASKNVLISRKPSKAGLPIPNPDWEFEKLDPEMLSVYPELDIPVTDEIKATMNRIWGAATQHPLTFFLQEFPWPLFDEARESAPVPPVAPVAPEPPPATAPVASEPWWPAPTANIEQQPIPQEPDWQVAQVASPVVNVPPPANPTPPPAPEGATSGLRKFMQG